MESPEVIARYELKYWLPPALVPEVRAYIGCYLKPDRGGAAQRNVSLYFDTLDHALYYDHVFGKPDRYKLRLRRYEGTEGILFAEIKRKVRQVVLKTRAQLPASALGALLGPSLPLQVPQLEPFAFLLASSRAEPRLIVSCRRHSFVPYDGLDSARATFDDDIAAHTWRGGFAFEPKHARPIDGENAHGLTGRRTMLELKFAHSAPVWMTELVKRFSLSLSAYSKFCTATRLEGECGDALLHREPYGPGERRSTPLELANF